MAFETTLDELMKEEKIDANQILHELLDERHIDMKTHIQDPITFAILESLINQLEQMLFTIKGRKLPITEKFLKEFIKQLKKYLVSWQRLSRKEITDTLKATKEQEMGDRSLFQRLTGIGIR